MVRNKGILWNKLFTLFLGQIIEEEIDLNPDYQRSVVWPDIKQIGLIDSILRNYYIPVSFCVSHCITTLIPTTKACDFWCDSFLVHHLCLLISGIQLCTKLQMVLKQGLVWTGSRCGAQWHISRISSNSNAH
jgi:hypothetical protein